RRGGGEGGGPRTPPRGGGGTGTHPHSPVHLVSGSIPVRNERSTPPPRSPPLWGGDTGGGTPLLVPGASGTMMPISSKRQTPSACATAASVWTESPPHRGGDQGGALSPGGGPAPPLRPAPRRGQSPPLWGGSLGPPP